MTEKPLIRKQTSTCQTLPDLLDTIENQERNGVFAKEFARLPVQPLFPCTVGKTEGAAKKNRQKDIVPYDHNRVILCHADVNMIDDEDDYINASFIRGIKNEGGFIATQSPMLGTMDDFWHLVWSENSRLAVMMCRLVEMCQNQSYRYWPDVGDYLDVDDIIISTEMEDERSSYVLRRFLLRHSKTGEQRKVVQLQFMAWPDNSLPNLPTLVSFWKEFNKYKASSSGPPIIHCSDGSQRTGLLIALDNTFSQWESQGTLDLFNCILRMREDRIGFVPTEGEYSYLYRLVVEAYLSRHSLRQSASLGLTSTDSDQYLCALPDDLQQEYQNLYRQSPSPVCFDLGPCNNSNGHSFSSELMSHSYRLQFPCDTGSVFATCVPLHRQSLVRQCEMKPTRLRHSVSLQENEMFLGINGVLPSDCKNSFLVTSVPSSGQSHDFWQMIFDTGCRCVVRLVQSEEDHLQQSDSRPVRTPDFSINKTAHTVLQETLQEITLSLSSNVEPVIPLVADLPSETIIKMFTVVWPGDEEQTRPSPDLMLLLFRLTSNWLSQSSTSLLALQCREDWSTAGQFCAAYNAVGSLSTDSQVDIFLIVRTILSRLPYAVSQAEYQQLYNLCGHFLHKHRHIMQQHQPQQSQPSHSHPLQPPATTRPSTCATVLNCHSSKP